MADDTKVAVLGTGIMGSAMARNLLSAGMEVRAWNRSREKSTGVDPAKFLETVDGGPLGLPYAQLKGTMMIEEDFPTSFSANLARKDAGLVLDAAGARDLRMGIAEAIVSRFDEAIEAGHGEEDVAAVYQALMVRPDRGESGLPLTRADWYS